MRILLMIGTCVVGLVVFAGYNFTRAGYESPEYEVLVRDGSLELRSYPALTLASTSMGGGPMDGETFSRLFQYISGANESESSISMTTPVLWDLEGEQRRMGFIVPDQVVRKGVPEATNSDVQIRTRDGGRFAAYRFSGGWQMEAFERGKKRLSEWVEKQGWNPVGEFEVANYDSPFTPPFFRRNEILIRVLENEPVPAESLARD